MRDVQPDLIDVADDGQRRPAGFARYACVGGTDDVASDLAFLLMDLAERGMRAAATSAATAGTQRAESAPETTVPLRDIVSPMVGTFYRAASPDAPAFVDVGKEVTEDSVVCIIEAMKVMDEIKAETRGVIAEIVAENGKPVQFGQVLYRVR